MNWIEAKIKTTHDGIEPITALLLELGITGSTVQDSQDFKQFIDTQQPYWDYVDESLSFLKDVETTVTVYLPQNNQGTEQLELLKRHLIKTKQQDEKDFFGPLEIDTNEVCDEDWENNWKQYFKPLYVGKQFLIKPSWEDLQEDCKNRTVLEIDPSASFGTGTHATTKLCIELLEEVIHGGETVLDMGCGSGILGIASVLLGANTVTAVDIDENAVRIAQENYRHNQIEHKLLKTFCGDAAKDPVLQEQLLCRKYDVILANIVTDVILSMLDLFMECMEDNGFLILSGIIAQRENELLEGLKMKKFNIIQRKEEDDWVSLLVKKHF